MSGNLEIDLKDWHLNWHYHINSAKYELKMTSSCDRLWLWFYWLGIPQSNMCVPHIADIWATKWITENCIIQI